MLDGPVGVELGRVMQATTDQASQFPRSSWLSGGCEAGRPRRMDDGRGRAGALPGTRWVHSSDRPPRGRTLTCRPEEERPPCDPRSNGPSEGIDLCVKRVEHCGHGLKRFEHYRLRLLLHAGGVIWAVRPRPPQPVRTRTFDPCP